MFHPRLAAQSSLLVAVAARLAAFGLLCLGCGVSSLFAMPQRHSGAAVPGVVAMAVMLAVIVMAVMAVMAVKAGLLRRVQGPSSCSKRAKLAAEACFCPPPPPPSPSPPPPPPFFLAELGFVCVAVSASALTS